MALAENASPRGVAEAISYAVTHGIVMGKKKHALLGTDLCHAPFTYCPSPVDAKCFQRAIDITIPLNHLVNSISENAGYLRKSLAEVAKVDSQFTGRLLAIYDAVPITPIKMSICRYDYFISADGPRKSLRMVEINCIASSFGSHATNTSQMHKFLATHPAYNLDVDINRLPPNNALADIAKGIYLAHDIFIQRYKVTTPCATVMIVQPGEHNAYDQYVLQAKLWAEHSVDLVRASLLDVITYGNVNDAGLLQLNLPDVGKAVIATVVYFRAGYGPDDYPSEKHWQARELIERSVAVKCPSVGTQLVGAKKIQQVLDLPGQVEQFVNESDAAAIRSTFARQYSLVPAEGGEDAARLGIDRPDDFVMKPQREGGGHNLFGETLKTALQTMSIDERAGYVLMERIHPVVVNNFLVRNGGVSKVDVVSELGTYGVHIVNGEDIFDSYAAGSLLRSKPVAENDGGIAAGLAVLDSPYLVQ